MNDPIRRPWLVLGLITLAVSGWAAFSGTVLGQLSIAHQMEQAHHRVEQAEAALATERDRTLNAQQQAEEMFQVSQRLSQEREAIIQSLQVKIATLEQRLKKYEPLDGP